MMIIDIHNFTVRSVVVFSTPTRHAGDLGSIVRPGMIYCILGLKTWLSTLETGDLCVFRMSHDTLKAVGPFYLVSMPGEVKYRDL